jgi:hypothetical protein
MNLEMTVTRSLKTRCLVLAFTLLALPLAAGAQQVVFVSQHDFPNVDFSRLVPGDAVPGQPGKVFQHTVLSTGGGGWFVTDGSTGPTNQELPPAADDQPPAPPVADEWEYTEAYTGVGTRVPVLLRTANPQRWFCKGCKYVAPYGDFRMTILDRLQLSDGNWAWVGQITLSGGAPARGTVLTYPLYGDRAMWLTEDEFNQAVQNNRSAR